MEKSKDINQYDDNRQLFNQYIINKLQELITKYPDMRFGQILVNAEIVKVISSDKQLLVEDPFYEESKTTWNRMKNNRFIFREYYNLKLSHSEIYLK